MTDSTPLPKRMADLVRTHRDVAHPGLWLDKFVESWDPTAGPGKLSERVQLPAVKHVAQLSATSPSGLNFDDLSKRHRELLSTLNATTLRATTIGPLTLHLARASSLENAGICLHPLYGFAYLPGSGLKGMTLAYAETVWLPTQSDQAVAWRAIEDVFGWANTPERRARLKKYPDQVRRRSDNDPEAPEQKESTGKMVFHDAWPKQWPKLIVDIVNNHHPDYYGASATDNAHPPGDWENPKPVYFLAVEPNTGFEFAVSSRRAGGSPASAEDDCLVNLAREWHAGALCHLGVGAKTNAGYGAFQLDPATDEALRKSVADVWEKAKTQKTRAEFTATLELVTPAFLAGAKHDDPNGCDLRPATLRGQLRWWWRTLHAGHVDVATLREMEAAIWGDTNSGGAIRVQVRRGNHSPPQLFDYRERFAPRPEFQRAHDLQPPPPMTTQGLFYASYGMNDGGRQRHFLPPGATWQVRVVARATRFAKHNVSADDVLEQARIAMALLCRYGGIGSKSRKGFGSLSSPEPKDIFVDHCQQIAADLRQQLDCKGEFNPSKAQSPALSQMLDLGPIELKTPWKDCWFLLDQLGASFQSFAQALESTGHGKHCDAKVALGLPRQIHGPRREPMDHQRRAGGHRQPIQLRVPIGDRHSSPVLYHVAQGLDGLLIRVAAFPSAQLPDMTASRALLSKLLNHLRSDLAERIQLHATKGQRAIHSGSAESKATGSAAGGISAKRAVNTPVKVKIIGMRAKSGFEVQEEGHPHKGVLNLGPVPDPPPNVGDVVDVLIKDDANPPQYQWKSPVTTAKTTSGKPSKHGGKNKK